MPEEPGHSGLRRWATAEGLPLRLNLALKRMKDYNSRVRRGYYYEE